MTVTAALIIVRICFSDGRLHYGGIQPVSIDRVATNVENLEYSAISLNVENSWNSQGILCNLRENVLTNEIVSVRSNICKKQLLTG